MKKFAFLTGNGFTLDFIEQLGLHSSFPLRNFNSLNIKYNNEFMDHLPYIKDNLLNSDLPDFFAIKEYVDSFKDIEEENKVLSKLGRYSEIRDPKYQIATDKHVQLRRFLAMAYSVLQLEVNKYDMTEWKWFKWLKENRKNLTIGISLNYDLILEKSLILAETPFFRVGTNELLSRVPLIKPHGSIDFDLPSNIIVTDNPWSISASLNDAQSVHIIPESKWLTPRIEADIISPSLHNIQLHLSWITRMYHLYSQMAKDIDALVIVGCSYWDVDRPEIDELLSKLERRTKVYVIDIDPNIELKKKIQSLGLSYREANSDGLPW